MAIALPQPSNNGFIRAVSLDSGEVPFVFVLSKDSVGPNLHNDDALHRRNISIIGCLDSRGACRQGTNLEAGSDLTFSMLFSFQTSGGVLSQE